MKRNEQIEQLIKRQINLVKLQECHKTRRALKNIKSNIVEKKQGILR